MLPFGLFFVL